MKLLTLAIAAYNMADYLNRCLDTVVGDSFADTLEVIVINDGSKDRTSEIAHSYEEKYPSIIKVVDKENGHYGSCINKALELATGKYFRPLDADDWVDTKNLNIFLSQLDNCDSDLVVTEYTSYEKKGIVQHTIPSLIECGKEYNSKELDFQKVGIDFLLKMHVMTFKTEVLRKSGLKLDTGINYTDNEYCMIPLGITSSIIFYPINVYQYYLLREGQTTQKKIIRNAGQQFFQIAQTMLKQYMHNRQKCNEVELSNQRCFLRLIIYYFLQSSLVFSSKDREKHKMVSAILDIISKDEVLYQEIISMRYRGIPFVSLWKQFGFQPFALIPNCLL